MHDIIIKTDESSLQDTIERFIDTVAEVPFGNSDWQNRQAIVNYELTPERAYRHASLRIMNRLQALNESYYNLRKEGVEVEKLKRKLAKLNSFWRLEKLGGDDDLERELIQIEIDKRASTKPYTQKLIADAIREIKSLEPVIQSMGKLTREKFEAGEAEHFRRRYHNQAVGKNDPLIGLEAMGIDLETRRAKADFQSLFELIVTEKKLLSEVEGSPY